MISEGNGQNRHSNKEIEAALKYAEDRGWRIEKRSGHAWGRLFCPFNDKACRCGEFCVASIWSTPRNPANHARQIRRIVDHCIGIGSEPGDTKTGKDGDEP